MQSRIEKLKTILESEIQPTRGCTDIGSVGFAVSRARRELGEKPDRVKVVVSANLYKNAMHVGVPGTGEQGLSIAAALGAVIDRHEAGLAIFDSISPEALAQARKYLAEGRVEVAFTGNEGALYIQATVVSAQNRASVTIVEDYLNIAAVTYNDEIRYRSKAGPATSGESPIRDYDYAEIYSLIREAEAGTFTAVLQAARTNRQSLLQSETDPAFSFNRIDPDRAIPRLLQPFRMGAQAFRWAGTASEARMRGADIAIMALCGSGNHGIIQSLGVLAVAESLGIEGAALEKALALSAATAVYIKSFMHRVTTLCGSALAGGAGIAAGTAYLLGGNYAEICHAIQTLIGSLNGMLCEGAGMLCPFKIGFAAQAAAQAGYLAVRKIYIPGGHGTLGRDIETTFQNLGKINASLADTERLMMEFIKSLEELQNPVSPVNPVTSPTGDLPQEPHCF